MTTTIKKIILTSILIFSVFTVFAKSQDSTQPHDGKITAIAVATVNGKQVVYTGSEDGFLIRWNEDGIGEHFQISDDRIEKIAVHPNGTDIAVYETDGLTVNRLSCWNWNTLTKRFSSKRLDSTITSLAYSARGTMLMIGQANITGIIFLNSTKGTVIANKVKETSGSITMSMTSRTENSSIMYSSLGYLVYTNLRTGAQTASFKIENNLSHPVLFHNNVLFAGVKGNYIYIYDATTGTILERIYAKNPFITTTTSDKNLYYFETDGKNSTLKTIEVQDGIINYNPLIVKKFSFQTWETPTIAVKSGNNILIGMKSGELYTVDTTPQVDTAIARKITERVYDKIYDIAEFNNEFYFLSKDSIFKSSFTDKTTTSIASNLGYTNMLASEDSIYLWSKSTKQPIISISLTNADKKTLFTPQSSLETLKVQGDKLLFIEGSSKVGFYDFITEKTSYIYTGTGVQDAILYGTDLYVAKTAAGNPKSSLARVDIETKETIPVNIKGEVSFSLAENETKNGAFYGASIVTENNETSTIVYSYNPNTRGYKTIVSLKAEDPEAFTYLKNGVLYTNISKTEIYYIPLANPSLKKLEQSASLPVKMIANEKNIAVLNKDGSITWFDARSKKMLHDWYITLQGEWVEN